MDVIKMSRLELNKHKLWYHADKVNQWMKGEYFTPIYTEINPSDKCNQHCWFCSTFNHLKKRNKSLKRNLYLKIMKEIGEAGIRSILFQGDGEPLMNEHTPDAIVAVKKYGVDPALVSNGVLFNKEIIEKTLPSLSWCRISSIEANKQLYNRTHGCIGTDYDKVIDNLKYAVAFKKNHDLKTVIGVTFIPFDYNVSRMYDTALLCKKIGVDYFSVKAFEVWDENPQHTWIPDLSNRYDTVFKQLESLNCFDFKVNVRYDMFRYHDNLFKKDFDRCYGVEFETYIDADGCLYPCHKFWGDNRYVLGDLSQQSFDEIWHGAQKLNVFDMLYNGYDLSRCRVKCKKAGINGELCRLMDPPLCVNFP
jgi:GTP 3',8-cyclase